MLGSLFIPDEFIRNHHLDNNQVTQGKVDVKAIVKTENWMRHQISQKGLGNPEQDLGSTAWTVLSSPIPIHQLYSNFYYDAYALLNIKQPIEQSTITLRHQHIKERTGFKNYATYNITTGALIDGPTPSMRNPISIGSTMALIQGVSVMGQQIEQGISVAINTYNADIHNPYYIRTFIYNDNYLEKQAAQIRQIQPEAIGFFSTAHATLEFIRQIGIEYLANQHLFGVSFLGENSIRRFLSQSGLHMTFGSVVPNPFLSMLPIAQEYRKQMDASHSQYNVYTFEAYIATSLFLDACNHIEPPITKEKLLSYFETFNQYEFKGLTLTFDKTERSFSLPVWIESDNEKEWPSFK